MTIQAIFAVAILLAASNARSADWLPVIGAVAAGDADVVEVLPSSLVVFESLRMLQVRTSRKTSRVSWDGVPFRSYEASVEFDCKERTARFKQVRYFLQPNWSGPSHKVMTYGLEKPRWMSFRDMLPNPTAKIIFAVCSLGRVATVQN